MTECRAEEKRRATAVIASVLVGSRVRALRVSRNGVWRGTYLGTLMSGRQEQTPARVSEEEKARYGAP